jgi:aminoglycoside phosphotransferase (APT) family kinase protein
MAAADDERIASELLRYLSVKLARPQLAYSEAIQSVSGGFDTAIFGFALEGAPPEARGRLILRLGREGSYPRRFALEAMTQNALADMEYPVPRALLVETDITLLGGPFIVMQRVSGTPLGHQAAGFFASGASNATRLASLARIPKTLGAINRIWVETQVRLHRLPPEPLLRAATDAGVDTRMLTFDGQLARLAATVEDNGLSALTPAVSWLQANRPDDRGSASICHGDFHPMNIIADDGIVTGVIDWANVAIAAAELDVASAVTNIATLPIRVPGAMRLPVRLLMATALRRYVAAYRQLRPLDAASLRYYQVFRAMVQLRPAAATLVAGRKGSGAFHSPAGIGNLISHIHAQGGPKLQLELPDE